MIAVEIIASAIIISHKPLNTPNVLGTKLAQTVDVPPDQSAQADSSPADNPPSDQPQTPPNDAPTPTQQPEPSPQPTPPSPDSFSTNSMQNYPDTSPSPTEIPQDQPPSAPSDNTPGQESTNSQPLIDFSASQQTAVLDTNQILTTPESISEKRSQDVQKEEAQLAQKTSPESQAPLVLNIIKDKPVQIDLDIKSGDFGSANFAASRMGDFVDKIQEIIKNLPPYQSSSIKKDIENLCAKSDYLLKSAQLMVPENSEQDFEITRGKCLSINL